VRTAVARPSKHLHQRRGHRVMLTISILVTGTHDDGRRFSEESHTVVLNPHGAMILLAEIVKPGQQLKIRHIMSGETRECTVADVGQKRDNKREVGIELLDSAAQFWHVAFPPDNWSPHSPEAKQFQAKPLANPLVPVLLGR